MASFDISKAFFTVSPKVKYPGRDGTITVYVPSICGGRKSLDIYADKSCKCKRMMV
jgi:hypothetical protein